MKKWIVLTLICTLLLMPAAWAEEDNEGTVIVIDDWTATEDAAPEASTEEDPFVPDTVGRAVFNADGRVTVFNPAAYPYSAIAYMDIVGTCGDHWSGTGFMVGKNRLLTASHCLVCSDHSAWAKTIDFYFGYKSRRNYLYRYSGSEGMDSMLYMMADAMAGLFRGAYFIAAPLIGVLGAFMSGSNTVSNTLFASIQFETATILGISQVLIVALQAMGGAIGNMICIHNIVAVCATTGTNGNEGRLIRTNIIPCLIYAFTVAAIVGIFLAAGVNPMPELLG